MPGLTLTRKLGERFRVGEDVWITITSITRHRVAVNIEAPKNVRISREELLREVVDTCTEEE